jgi:hypothetical protein
MRFSQYPPCAGAFRDRYYAAVSCVVQLSVTYETTPGGCGCIAAHSGGRAAPSVTGIIPVRHSSTDLSIPADRFARRFTHDAMEGLRPEVCGRWSPEHQGNVRVLKRILDLIPSADTDLQRR